MRAPASDAIAARRAHLVATAVVEIGSGLALSSVSIAPAAA